MLNLHSKTHLGCVTRTTSNKNKIMTNSEQWNENGANLSILFHSSVRRSSQSAKLINPAIIGISSRPIRNHSGEGHSAHRLHHSRRVLLRERRVPAVLILHHRPIDLLCAALLFVLFVAAALLYDIVQIQRWDPILRHAVHEESVRQLPEFPAVGALVVVQGRDRLVVFRRVIGIDVRVASVSVFYVFMKAIELFSRENIKKIMKGLFTFDKINGTTVHFCNLKVKMKKENQAVKNVKKKVIKFRK